MPAIEFPCPICDVEIEIPYDPDTPALAVGPDGSVPMPLDMRPMDHHIETHEPRIIEPFALRCETGATFSEAGVSEPCVSLRFVAEGEVGVILLDAVDARVVAMQLMTQAAELDDNVV